MSRFLSLSEVLELHRRLIVTSGGLPGLRDLGLLEASLSQPRQTFSGTDIYPTLVDKAATLGFSLIRNHPFVDEMLNGYELAASTEAAEATILVVASGALGRQALTDWVRKMIKRSS